MFLYSSGSVTSSHSCGVCAHFPTPGPLLHNIQDDTILSEPEPPPRDQGVSWSNSLELAYPGSVTNGSSQYSQRRTPSASVADTSDSAFAAAENVRPSAVVATLSPSEAAD